MCCTHDLYYDHKATATGLTPSSRGVKAMTFWGEFSLGCLVAYALSCYLVGLIPGPKRDREAKSMDHGLHGGNREKSESKFYGWH
jgi:hypothetical protein